jgi:AbiV family abortive infection protein
MAADRAGQRKMREASWPLPRLTPTYQRPRRSGRTMLSRPSPDGQFAAEWASRCAPVVGALLYQDSVDQQDNAVDPVGLAFALLDNADLLLSDAELLLINNRVPRAAALALIASEELSKLYLCLGAITGEAVVPSAKSRDWRDHRDKLETAKALDIAFIDAEPDLDMDQAKTDIDALLRLKMACLCVDHDVGDIVSPTDVEVDAKELIDRGRERAALLRGVFDGIIPEALEAIDLHYEAMSRLVEALIDRDHPEETIDRLRSVFAATQQGDAVALAEFLAESQATDEHRKGTSSVLDKDAGQKAMRPLTAD